MQRHGSEPPSHLLRPGRDSSAQLQQRSGLGAGCSHSVTTCLPTRGLQTRLILHEVPVNATAFTVSRSSARADDDEGVYNNIFYLYHTFQTEHEISAPFTAVPGGNNPPSCSRVGLQRCRELLLGKGTATAAPAGRPPPLLRPLTQLRRRG